jgi:hypothetical protein
MVVELCVHESSYFHYRKHGSEFLQLFDFLYVLKTYTYGSMVHKPIYVCNVRPLVIMFMGSW